MQGCGSDPAAHRDVSGQQVIDSTKKCGLFGKPVEVPVNEKLKHSSNNSKPCLVIVTDQLVGTPCLP